MRRFWLSAVAGAAVAIAMPVVAQVTSPADPAASQQREIRRGMRGPRGEPGQRFEGAFERMAERLELDEPQRVQYEAIVQPYRDAMRARFEKMRQLREARQSGDDETAAQLQAELQDAGPPPPEVFDKVAGEVEAILRPEQVEKLRSWRAEFSQRQGQRGQMRRAIDELPGELGLTEEQQGHFDEIVEQHRQEMRQRFEGMRDTMEAMRAAEEAGDEQKIAELRAQLDANRPDRGPEMLKDFFAKLEPILTDEQKPLLAAYQEKLATMPPAGPGGPPEAGDIRSLFRATRRLKLDADQEDQVRELEREIMRTEREARRASAEERATLFAEAKNKVRALLSDEQKAELDQALERGGRPPRVQRRGSDAEGPRPR